MRVIKGTGGRRLLQRGNGQMAGSYTQAGLTPPPAAETSTVPTPTVPTPTVPAPATTAKYTAAYEAYRQIPGVRRPTDMYRPPASKAWNPDDAGQKSQWQEFAIGLTFAIRLAAKASRAFDRFTK